MFCRRRLQCAKSVQEVSQQVFHLFQVPSGAIIVFFRLIVPLWFLWMIVNSVFFNDFGLLPIKIFNQKCSICGSNVYLLLNPLNVPSCNRLVAIKHEHDGNELQVTQGFRTHVARKLEHLLDRWARKELHVAAECLPDYFQLLVAKVEYLNMPLKKYWIWTVFCSVITQGETSCSEVKHIDDDGDDEGNICIWWCFIGII